MSEKKLALPVEFPFSLHKSTWKGPNYIGSNWKGRSNILY